ncbi:Rieske (2Fe-2S) protein [Streptomyces sp. URMC 126]|uniref:Rieske (2Fe-2S) protein n=1 Tax=Streptomyces sp. URMC 126 TaxID=3423401 RepID=UPI003F1DA2CB
MKTEPVMGEAITRAATATAVTGTTGETAATGATDAADGAGATVEAVVETLPGGKWCAVRLADRVVRVPARCPHRGAPLAAGLVTGTFLECPWHGATFDLRTGHRVRGPQCADLAVRRYEPDAPERPAAGGTAAGGTAEPEEGST